LIVLIINNLTTMFRLDILMIRQELRCRGLFRERREAALLALDS